MKRSVLTYCILSLFAILGFSACDVHVASHSKFFYLLNISELSILKNMTANDLETSYILFLSQLCNIQRTL